MLLADSEYEMPSPRIRVYIAASLDGFIATADGGVAWLRRFDAEDYGYADFATEIGTIVMGRTTYQQVRGFGAWPYAGKRGFVLSSQLIDPMPDGMAAWRGDVDALISVLTDGDRDAWIVGNCAPGLKADGCVRT